MKTPTNQQKPRHNRHYPVSRAIAEILAERGLSRTAAVGALGCRNMNKGLRRLDHWLEHGGGSAPFFRALCGLFPEERSRLLEALEETALRKQQQARQRALELFKPSLTAETEIWPQSMFGAMLAHRLQRVEVSGEIDLIEAGRLARAHFTAHGGCCAQFGAIIRYRCEFRFGEKIYLDPDGRPMAGK